MMLFQFFTTTLGLSCIIYAAFASHHHGASGKPSKRLQNVQPDRVTNASILDYESDFGSDHHDPSASAELFSPQLLNQLTRAAEEEGKRLSSGIPPDVNSLFSDMFQSSCENGINRFMSRYKASQNIPRYTNIITTKVCNPEWRKNNIPLTMLQKVSWDETEFRSAVLLVLKDAWATSGNQSHTSVDVSRASANTNRVSKEYVKRMIGELFDGFFRKYDLQNSDELWISFLKLFFTIRYPYVEISSAVTSHAIQVSANLATTEVDRWNWVKTFHAVLYDTIPNEVTGQILIDAQKAMLQQFIKESPCKLDLEIFQQLLQRYRNFELYQLIKEGREYMNVLFQNIELEIKQMDARL